jgi:hypothetical protein
MKKTILVSFALALLFTACAKKKTDASLTGTWRGKTTSSSLESLQALLGNKTTDNSAATEIIVYRIDDNSFETYKSKDEGLEVDIGKYEAEKNVISFKIDATSCIENTNYPTLRKIPYKVSADLKTLTITDSYLKTIVLEKVDQVEANGIQQAVTTADKGCFSDKDGHPSKFKSHPVEKIGHPVEVDSDTDETTDSTDSTTAQ